MSGAEGLLASHQFANCIARRYDDWVEVDYGNRHITSNWPPDDPAFAAVAQSCGFGPDRLMDYVWEHELLHVIVPQQLFKLEIGYVHAQAAWGLSINPLASAAEENIIYHVQRAMMGDSYSPIHDMAWKLSDVLSAIGRA